MNEQTDGEKEKFRRPDFYFEKRKRGGCVEEASAACKQRMLSERQNNIVFY